MSQAQVLSVISRPCKPLDQRRNSTLGAVFSIFPSIRFPPDGLLCSAFLHLNCFLIRARISGWTFLLTLILQTKGLARWNPFETLKVEKLPSDRMKVSSNLFLSPFFRFFSPQKFQSCWINQKFFDMFIGPKDESVLFIFHEKKYFETVKSSKAVQSIASRIRSFSISLNGNIFGAFGSYRWSGFESRLKVFIRLFTWCEKRWPTVRNSAQMCCN